MTKLETSLLEYIKEYWLDDIRHVVENLNNSYNRTQMPIIINGSLDIITIEHKTLDIELRYNYSQNGITFIGGILANQKDIEERVLSLNSLKELL